MKRRLFTLAGLLTLGACQREERHFEEPAQAAQLAPPPVQVSTLHPGQAPAPTPAVWPEEKRAYDLSEGKRIYEGFNCVGCHAHGGGGMGPPLMDAQWRYGGAPQNIYASIAEGRPNGMPTFGGKIAEQQLWQLVAYVRSMSGQAPMDAAPNRNDSLSFSRPEAVRQKEGPGDEGQELPR